jgi:hypothetical protein
MLSVIILRYTRMQVFEVEDGMSIQINCVYIITPNHDMACSDGTLQLLGPGAPRAQRLPVVCDCEDGTRSSETYSVVCQDAVPRPNNPFM